MPRDAGRVRQLEEAEQLAVEQEDFEYAANLSSELDGLRSTAAPVKWLQSMLASLSVSHVLYWPDAALTCDWDLAYHVCRP